MQTCSPAVAAYAQGFWLENRASFHRPGSSNSGRWAAGNWRAEQQRLEAMSIDVDAAETPGRFVGIMPAVPSRSF